MLKGQPLTEEEVDNICMELKEKDVREMARLEDELAVYHKIYGPLPSHSGKGPTTNKEIAQNE